MDLLEELLDLSALGAMPPQSLLYNRYRFFAHDPVLEGNFNKA